MAKNMNEGNPAKLILSFAGPMVLGNIFQQFYNLIDAIVVGRFVGANALAAVGSSGSTNFLLISLMMGLTNGASIIIAQYFGHEDLKTMRKAIVSLIHIILIVGVITSIVGVAASRSILTFLHTPEVIIEDAVLFMRIFFAGVLAMAIYNMCSAVLRSIGDSKTPLFSLIFASLVNVALDLLFVVVFHWGVAGVAVATLIAQICSAVFCIFIIVKKHPILHIQKDEIQWHGDLVKKIAQLGVPTALQSSLIAIGNMSVQSLVNSCGEITMAAYTAASKIDSIAIQPIVSVGTAMSIFTGQNIGGGNIDRIKKALKQVLAIMVTGCIVVAGFIVIFRVQLLSLFLDKEEAYEAILIGSEYLQIVCVAYIIAGIMQTFLNVIRGAGDVNASMAAGLVELSTRVSLSYLLIHYLGSTGLWLAIPLSWGSACTVTVIRYLSGKWKAKAVVR
ncbi:MATE family efflux transporter [Konateibacter massiliensis]|uniref:MATE family efflux transporter n=1 Tax=Konateibacter massiliensis TaxID=2002841 RepID=UPI000C14F397|nr:MATE family efflux transporter [Konateibacter massiliensis]